MMKLKFLNSRLKLKILAVANDFFLLLLLLFYFIFYLIVTMVER